MFEWEYVKSDHPKDYPDTVYLSCKNRGTLHDICDNAKETKE